MRTPKNPRPLTQSTLEDANRIAMTNADENTRATGSTPPTNNPDPLRGPWTVYYRVKPTESGPNPPWQYWGTFSDHTIAETQADKRRGWGYEAYCQKYVTPEIPPPNYGLALRNSSAQMQKMHQLEAEILFWRMTCESALGLCKGLLSADVKVSRIESTMEGALRLAPSSDNA